MGHHHWKSDQTLITIFRGQPRCMANGHMLRRKRKRHHLESSWIPKQPAVSKLSTLDFKKRICCLSVTNKEILRYSRTNAGKSNSQTLGWDRRFKEQKISQMISICRNKAFENFHGCKNSRSAPNTFRQLDSATISGRPTVCKQIESFCQIRYRMPEPHQNWALPKVVFYNDPRNVDSPNAWKAYNRVLANRNFYMEPQKTLDKGKNSKKVSPSLYLTSILKTASNRKILAETLNNCAKLTTLNNPSILCLKQPRRSLSWRSDISIE